MSRFGAMLDPLREPSLIDRSIARKRVSAEVNARLGLALTPAEVEGVLDGLWALGVGLRMVGEGWAP